MTQPATPAPSPSLGCPPLQHGLPLPLHGLVLLLVPQLLQLSDVLDVSLVQLPLLATQRAVAIRLKLAHLGRVAGNQALDLGLETANLTGHKHRTARDRCRPVRNSRAHSPSTTHRLLLDPPRLLVHPPLLLQLRARLVQALQPPQFSRMPAPRSLREGRASLQSKITHQVLLFPPIILPLLRVPDALLVLPLSVLQLQVEMVAALTQRPFVLNKLFYAGYGTGFAVELVKIWL